MNDLLTEEGFINVGRTGGLYGYEGSMRLNVNSEINEQLNNNVTFLYFKVSGMFVPRFICSWDKDQSLVRFDRIAAREEARILTDQVVYLRKRDLQKSKFIRREGQNPWKMVDGFQLWDVQRDVLMGCITGVEEYPAGWMAEIQKKDGGAFLLIPLAEPLVEWIDEENQVLYMNLPEGLDEL